jgi:hypothetical protein
MRGALVIAFAAAGCNQILGNGHDFKGPSGDARVFDAPVDACASCMQVDCASMGLGPTTLTGVAYMPDGVTPLANAQIYVPGTTLATIADGVGPPVCASGQPIVRTISAADGSFTLTNAPSGSGIPLVVQVGKWRRENVMLQSVPQCMTTALPADQTRLPRVPIEGHIPFIAITTGAADTLECITKDIGLDASVIGPPGPATRVHLYAGGGTSNMAPPSNAPLPAATALYGIFNQYDVVMFGCTGNPMTPPVAANAALQTFANDGGWVFLSHFTETWLQNGPAPWPTLAMFMPVGPMPAPGIQVLIDPAAPTGTIFGQWVVAAGASPTPGQISLTNGRNTCMSNDTTQTQRVMYIDPSVNGGVPSVQSFTWSAMNGGRVTFTDMHVSNSNSKVAYPTECQPITDTEKAIMFQLFDVPGC